MKLKSSAKKYSRWNFFILAVLLILVFSVFYYLYHRQRIGANVYISVLLTPSQTTVVSSTNPFMGVPYWIDQAITKGDKELSPFGGVKAIVVKKDSYESFNYGRVVALLLSANAVRDRSGVFLFDNKPLAVGSIIDLNLPKVEAFGQITYVGEEKPADHSVELVIHILRKAVDRALADNINIGDTIYDSNHNVIAKITGRSESPSSGAGNLEYNPISNQQTLTYGNLEVDVDITVEITAEKEYDTYYFAKTQDVKINEPIYLSFPDMSLSYTVTSIKEVKQ
ncbi:MAG: hypothetical protein M1366_01635 [Patescibacteria group bacterium]|nr:hypothetical protein [Patescibacteria group bacterium]